jgi:beta-galactosidase
MKKIFETGIILSVRHLLCHSLVRHQFYSAFPGCGIILQQLQKNFSSIPLLLAVTLLLTIQSNAQPLVKGGLAGNQQLILVGDKAENIKNKNLLPAQVSYLHYDDSKEKIQFAPQLPGGWNWVALFNTKAKNKTVNYFMYDGWLAATDRITSNHRLRRFENDITQKISSNAWHMAFQRKQVVENEVFMLVISPAKQKVKIKLSKEEFGVERILEYEMEELEAKFVHIVMPPPEYTVITWQPEQTERNRKAITSNWLFYFDKKGNDGLVDASLTFRAANFIQRGGERVNLPHTWNATDVFDNRNFKDSINIMEMFQRGVGWYKTTVTIPASEKNKEYNIHFLGANQVTEAWFNGKYLGKHIGGYMGFQFNITNYVKYGLPNELVIKVDNRFNFDIPPHTADYNFQGGIYREVYLTVTNQSFIKQTKFTTPKVSHRNASVAIQTSFANNNAAVKKVVVNLINPYNEIMQSWVQAVASNQQSIQITDTIRNPVFWSPQRPTLYQLYTTLYDAEGNALDQTKENVGFRSFNFTADSGFYLNGERLKLKGVNVHQDYLNKGWAVDSVQKREDYLWMKKMGVNYVRMSHYPKHPYELHLCDSLGFIVWEEIPVVNTVGRDAFIENAKMMMREVIERDYNRPSVIFWGVGNEYYRNFFTAEDAAYALKCTKEAGAICKQLDPYRYSIQAQNDLVDYEIFKFTDVQGRNRYFGWYEKTYNDFEQEMEEEHKKHPDWKLLVSEYGAEGKYGYHVTHPKIFDHSETYQLNFHKEYWRVINKYPYLAGGTIWNMFDFASFAKIGNSPHINKKGMLTFDRKPKDVFYFYQSVWTDEAMIRIAGHTYTHRRTEAGKPLPLEVFSNGETVELFVNGQSQGKKMKADGFIWSVVLPEGYHRIKAVAVKEGITVKDETAFLLRHGKTNDKGEEVGELDGDGF